MATSETYFISAGELSGDLLGGDLIAALASAWPAGQAYGVVGPNMRRAGARELRGMEELSVMGFVEVLRHFPELKMLEVELLAKIERLRPRFAILIDYPGFHLRLAEQLKLRGIPVIQYVAPQLWAWGEGRTERLKAVTDHVLGIMPFEEGFFRERGVNYHYVGTPQVDRVRRAGGERAEFGLAGPGEVYGFFPGSRRHEIERLVPVAMAIIRVIARERPRAQFALSLAPTVSADLMHRAAFADSEAAPSPERFAADLMTRGHHHDAHRRLTVVRGRSLDLMTLCDAALVTSGTATLECGLAGTPMAAAYVMNRMSYQMAKRLVTLPHISLVNLVAGEGIIEEFVQDVCPDAVAQSMIALATDPPTREAVRERLARLHDKVHGEPGRHAAATIARLMGLESAAARA